MEQTQIVITKIAQALEQKYWYLCTAESCTGGLLGHMITNFPGASAFYLGGQITYSNDAKMRWLGVHAETLRSHGAVSEETVLEMADGIRSAFEKSVPREKLVGVSISGIAGPSGGSAEKPVGTVWIGLSLAEYHTAKCFTFEGDRQEIKNQAAQQALSLLLRKITD